MKRHFTFFYAVLLALLTLPMLSGCSNNDDDLKVIFTGKVWKMSYIFREGNPKAYVNFWYDDREAEAASKMTHHNIVNLLDVSMDGENRYLVMEYVQGKTLKEVIYMAFTDYAHLEVD